MTASAKLGYSISHNRGRENGSAVRAMRSDGLFALIDGGKISAGPYNNIYSIKVGHSKSTLIREADDK